MKPIVLNIHRVITNKQMNTFPPTETDKPNQFIIGCPISKKIREPLWNIQHFLPLCNFIVKHFAELHWLYWIYEFISVTNEVWLSLLEGTSLWDGQFVTWYWSFWGLLDKSVWYHVHMSHHSHITLFFVPALP